MLGDAAKLVSALCTGNLSVTYKITAKDQAVFLGDGFYRCKQHSQFRFRFNVLPVIKVEDAIV